MQLEIAQTPNETSVGPRAGPGPGPLTLGPRPSRKKPGPPAGFLDFFLFFKRISDLEFSSEYQKSKFFSKF
jgi:hypothetical protein